MKLHSLLPASLRQTTRIVAVSPDPPHDIRKIVDKVRPRTGGEFSIVLLSDADHKVIDRYGLRNEQAAEQGRYLPHPTTYVIDKQGVVRWKFTEKDYRIRPSNESILRELEKLP